MLLGEVLVNMKLGKLKKKERETMVTKTLVQFLVNNMVGGESLLVKFQ